jgi:hypothetical protein
MSMQTSHSTPDLSRRHHLLIFSQKSGCENVWRKFVDIINLNNVSSNFFQNILSGLADGSAKNPKWQCWG